MPPFVSKKHLKEADYEGEEDIEYEVRILAIAKKTKLSFEELNLLSLDDFFNYVDLFVGDSGEKETVRQATQNDIDDFYRM